MPFSNSRYELIWMGVEFNSGKGEAIERVFGRTLQKIQFGSAFFSM